jgi:DNA polymerase-3 subunit gamma/tau
MSDLDPVLDDDAPERDPNTADIFGGPPAAPPAPAAAYEVLARKYRPRTFEDLIGQEAMVRTLTNAFAHDRIAHAFMLTGVRGVGKTTTARLLARALNYESDSVHKPSVDLTVEGRHCRAIIEGRHMDVLELDAASRTKVDEMRELLDSVRYAPVEARYKVYVIDEVHMLSTAAFNALLKTLEEPPPHAKFIFATTEIRKVPVTILSRTQRFDLRRVEPDVLKAHLAGIVAQEGAAVEDEGLALIARAAEGSVRDGLSLLDQAIVQSQDGGVVPAEAVRDMLGLADRAQTIALFEQLMRGEAGEAITTFRTLYGFGADPVVVMLDLLEHAHGAALAKTLGPDALGLPKEQAGRLAAVGAAASAGTLSRLWQMLLKAHEETRRAPDPAAAVEMAIIRLAYAADLPGPEEALKLLQEGGSLPPPGPSGGGGGGGGGLRTGTGGGGSAVFAGSAQPARSPAAAEAAAPTLASFADVLELIAARREIVLQADVQRFVRLVSFRPDEGKGGAVAFSLAQGAPPNLPQRLSQKLREWTGRPWLMDLREDDSGVETAWERARREEAAYRAEVAADPFVQALMQTFPGSELIVRPRPAAAPAATPPEPGPDLDDDRVGDVLPDEELSGDDAMPDTGLDGLDEDDIR